MSERETQSVLESKRKRSQSSPELETSTKSLRMGKPEANNSSPDSKAMLKDISTRFGNFEHTMDQMIKFTQTVSEQNSKVMERLDAIDKDNKTRIEQNTKDIKDMRVNQAKYAKDTDARLMGIENKVSNLANLLEGGAGSQPLLSGKYNHETEHERQLAALIEEARSIVTILGCRDPEINGAKIAQLLTEAGYQLPGPVARTFLGVTKLGNPSAEAPPLKVQLDSPASAEKLLDQARTLARENRNSGKEGTLEIRVVKHYPQPYSMAAKDFRQMSAYIYENGGLAHMEYEGTTLTLRGKSREAGGQWVIVKGCTFKPAAVGREVPCEGETPEMSTARVLLDKIVDNRGTSIAARSLFYKTEEELTTLKDVQNHLGPVLSEDLVKVEPCKSITRGKYTLVYKTRKATVDALHRSKSKDLITGMDKDHDSFALKVAVATHDP